MTPIEIKGLLSVIKETEENAPILEMLNKIISNIENSDSKTDSIEIPIKITTTIKKFDGNDTTAEPTETLIFTD